MHLSKLLLVGERFRNPYEIHRAIWKLFPKSSMENRDFLFRIERSAGRNAEVLLLSRRKPSNSEKDSLVTASKKFDFYPVSGQVLRFLLVANPIKTVADSEGRLNSKGKTKKCRVPLITEDEQSDWLRRKLGDSAQLIELEIVKKAPSYFRKQGKAGKIQPYIFKGLLRVQNSDSFQVLHHKGIGPAKAFGCGMISIANV